VSESGSARDPRVVLAVLAVLMLAGLSLILLWPSVPTLEGARERARSLLESVDHARTEATVRDAHRDLVEALADGDADAVWEGLSPELQRRIEESWERLRAEDPSWTARWLEARGWPAGLLEAPDARSLVARALGAPGATSREDEVRALRDLEIERVTTSRLGDQEFATVECRGDPGFRGEPWMPYFYERSRGDAVWRLCGIARFLPLERKVDAPLPREPIDRTAVAAVVSVGAGGLSATDAERLRDALSAARRPGNVVVLDVAPRIPWQDAVRAFETIRGAGTWAVAFAAATDEGPGPGVRVNGVTLDGEGEPVEPATHPAAQRVVGLRPRDTFFADRPGYEAR
jgi:hypothetical protein